VLDSFARVDCPLSWRLLQGVGESGFCCPLLHGVGGWFFRAQISEACTWQPKRAGGCRQLRRDFGCGSGYGLTHLSRWPSLLM